MAQSIADQSENAVFQFRLAQAITAAQRASRHVALLMISLEPAGDSGLEAGPFLPQCFDRAWLRIRNSHRDSDAVCQINGAQTALILPRIAGPDDAVLVAKKILDNIAEPVQLEALRMSVRGRVGIALFPSHATTAASLIECAENALTAAHRTNQPFAFYTAEPNSPQQLTIRLSELRQAIVRNQLFIQYQPKIDLKANAIAGVEALTRWGHPNHGLVAPDQFIPVAERTGLIIPLTLWVLHHSLVQCRTWNELGFNVTVAVNLSMWNLDALELPAQIEGLLKTVDIPPHRLELEITESAIMDDPQRAVRTLNAIRSLGVHFTIDDFGTGYSSLTHLKRLPVACIKIDKSFVLNMQTDKDDAVIVRSIIDLGHNLGLKVIAEGVETAQAREMLAEFGCDEAQGYYFSYPLLPGEITHLLYKSASVAEPEGASASSADIAVHLEHVPQLAHLPNSTLFHCK